MSFDALLVGATCPKLEEFEFELQKSRTRQNTLCYTQFHFEILSENFSVEL